MSYRSRILGIGMSVPSRVVTNNDLADRMETSHEWIVERTGIEQRHWVSEGETGATESEDEDPDPAQAFAGHAAGDQDRGDDPRRRRFAMVAPRPKAIAGAT